MSVLVSSVQLSQLQAIAKMRVKKLHEFYLAKLADWREERRKVEEQQTEIAQLNQDYQRVIEYLERADVCSDPVKLQLAAARRHWLIYDREKAEFYLEIAEDDLKKQSLVLEESKKTWLKAIARENRITEQRCVAEGIERHKKEQRREIESDDTVGGKTMAMFNTTNRVS